LEGDDHGVGIAEQTADAGLGNESGEPVEVVEELEFGHRQSMTRIPQEGKSRFLRKSRGFCSFEAKNYPLESRKSRKKTYGFSLVLTVPTLSLGECDVLYEAGCDDGTIGFDIHDASIVTVVRPSQ
jgi:hypothetical protein